MASVSTVATLGLSIMMIVNHCKETPDPNKEDSFSDSSVDLDDQDIELKIPLDPRYTTDGISLYYQSKPKCELF